MNTASIALTILIGLVVVLALLFWWLIRTFASMNKKEKEIFEGLSAFAPNVIESSYINDLAKALDEKELRDKVKKITNKVNDEKK